MAPQTITVSRISESQLNNIFKNYVDSKGGVESMTENDKHVMEGLAHIIHQLADYGTENIREISVKDRSGNVKLKISTINQGYEKWQVDQTDMKRYDWWGILKETFTIAYDTLMETVARLLRIVVGVPASIIRGVTGVVAGAIGY